LNTRKRRKEKRMNDAPFFSLAVPWAGVTSGQDREGW